MLVINSSEVRALLPMKEAIEADKQAFLLHATRQTEVPVRTAFKLEGGTALVMPAWVRGDIDRVGVKIISVFEGNRAKGLPVVPAQMVLFDSETGEVAAIINGVELTRVRTGAISGAAIEILAREDASVGALFGTGGQASAQLEAMLCARPLKEVRIFDTVRDRIAPFIGAHRELAERHGASLVEASSSDGAIDEADIITAVTTSAVPVFDGARVRDGAHVNGVGSFTPDKRELDEAIIRRARVYVDNMDAVMEEAGDILIPIADGRFSQSAIVGEIGGVLAGTVRGRESASEITLLKTVGFAVLDVIAAVRVYENAVERGMGSRVDI